MSGDIRFGFHNFSVKLMYFAEEKQIRIYADGGQYVTADSLEELPGKLKLMMALSGKSTLGAKE